MLQSQPSAVRLMARHPVLGVTRPGLVERETARESIAEARARLSRNIVFIRTQLGGTPPRWFKPVERALLWFLNESAEPLNEQTRDDVLLYELFTSIERGRVDGFRRVYHLASQAYAAARVAVLERLLLKSEIEDFLLAINELTIAAAGETTDGAVYKGIASLPGASASRLSVVIFGADLTRDRRLFGSPAI